MRNTNRGPQVCCEVCGNEFAGALAHCPYCGTQQSGAPATPRTSGRGQIHQVINLKRDLPTVEQALQRFRTAMDQGRRQGLQVLTFIHGYGSSGRGGAIRLAVREQLAFLKRQHRINDFILGEEFRRSAGPTRNLLRRFPALTNHRDLNRANQGITLVVL